MSEEYDESGMAPMPVLYMEDLEAITECGCCNPNCDKKHDKNEPLLMSSQCHPMLGLIVSYVRGSGILHMECPVCGAVVADVAVEGLNHG